MAVPPRVWRSGCAARCLHVIVASMHVTRPLYMLNGTATEDRRLRAQSKTLRGHTEELLDRVGLRAGAQVLHLGCGPGGAIDLLAARVGPAGRVIGADLDLDHLVSARDLADERGLTNVTLVRLDARHTGLPPEAFDLVHARLLLVDIPEAGEVVAEMARLAAPGGWVALLEPDASLRACYPPHPAWQELTALLAEAYRAYGAEPDIGRRLPSLLRGAGVVDVGAEARADVCRVGHPQRTVMLDIVQNMRARILDVQLVSERELDELDRAAREHLEDPDTLIVPVTYFMAWGRRPIT
jgi:SAM-dependent methyltransferase